MTLIRVSFQGGRPKIGEQTKEQKGNEKVGSERDSLKKRRYEPKEKPKTKLETGFSYQKG